jgi:hypothetical protein
MSSLGRVEVSLEYGQDWQLTSTGDVLLAVDATDNALATRQWLERLLLTSPTLIDANGNRIARADDIGHPSWGAGLRRAVGQMVTNSLLASIQSAIVKAIASNSSVATSPAPVISVTDAGNGFIVASVDCVTTAGQRLVVSQQLSVFGG